MKKILCYVLMFLIVFTFVIGMGAEPHESTSIEGFLLFKISAAVIIAALCGTLKHTGLIKYMKPEKEEES